MMEKTETTSDDNTTHMSADEPRESLIATAVKFLQNPKVRQSPFQQRKAFLERKGLTDEEIRIAVERSGTGSDATAIQPVATPNTAQTAVIPPPQPVSAWSRGRDYLATAIVVGGVSYAIYVFYKKYVAPLWFGPSKEQQQMNELTKGMLELQQTMNDTLRHIQETQNVLSKQQEVMQDLARNFAASRGPMELDRMQDGQAFTEIKEEVRSLKALLLSSRRFPAAPTTAPVLPSWQLSTTKAQDSSSSNAVETTVTESNKGNRTSEMESGDASANDSASARGSPNQEESDSASKIGHSAELQDVSASQNVVTDDTSLDLLSQSEQELITNLNTDSAVLENANQDQMTVEATA